MRSWIIYISLLLVLSTIYLHAEEPLMNYIPEEMHIERSYFAKGEVFPAGETILWKENGILHLSTDAPNITWKVQFSPDMEVDKAEMRCLDPEMMDQLGVKEYTVEKMLPGEYRFSYLDDSGNEGSRVEELESALDFSLLSFKLQAIFHQRGEIDSLEVQLFNSKRVINYGMALNSKRQTITEAIEYAEDYDFPEEAVALLSEGKEYLLVEGELTGMAKRFYPHHFYFLLDPDMEYRSILEWGANPRKAYFIFNQYS